MLDQTWFRETLIIQSGIKLNESINKLYMNNNVYKFV